MSHTFVDVMEGRVSDREIKEQSARIVLATVQHEMGNQHPAEGCKVKDCIHGNQRWIDKAIQHAATLTEEANAL